MHKKFLLPVLLLFGFLTSQNTYAQCTEFVLNEGFATLDTSRYIPEGRFDAMILSQGDYLKVYKSFFKGKTYRIAVCADKKIIELNFKVKTMQGDVIYDSKNSDSKKHGIILPIKIRI